MKKLAWLLFLGCMLFPQVSEASFMANCILKVGITKVKGTVAKGKYKQLYVPVNFKVKKILKEGGHVKGYCTLGRFLGSRFSVKLVVPNKKIGKKLKSGSVVKVSYTYISGMTPKGAVSSKTWSFIALFN